MRRHAIPVQTLLIASLWLASASAADASDRKQAVYSSQSRGAEHGQRASASPSREQYSGNSSGNRSGSRHDSDDHRGRGQGHDQHGRGNGYGHDNGRDNDDDRGRGHGSGHGSGYNPGNNHHDRDDDDRYGHRHGTRWQGDRHQHYRDYDVVYHYPAPPPQPRVIYVRDHYGHYRNYHLDVAWHGHFYDPAYFHGGVHVHTGCHYHHFGDALVTGVAIGLILGNW